MSEDTETVSVTPAKSKPKAVAMSPVSAFEMPKFEMPKFEMPKFDMPKVEVPAAFREIAEKGVAQAKEGYEKMKNAAEDATEMLEATYAKASKGYSAYGLKLIETARANSNATFDLFGQVLSAKSAAEAVELYTAFARSQFEAVSAQAKELTDHAQKVATETVEPIKEGFTSAFNKAA
jgi:phasin